MKAKHLTIAAYSDGTRYLWIWNTNHSERRYKIDTHTRQKRVEELFSWGHYDYTLVQAGVFFHSDAIYVGYQIVRSKRHYEKEILEEECTCSPRMDFMQDEICPVCKRQIQLRYGDEIPIEGEF